MVVENGRRKLSSKMVVENSQKQWPGIMFFKHRPKTIHNLPCELKSFGGVVDVIVGEGWEVVRCIEGRVWWEVVVCGRESRSWWEVLCGMVCWELVCGRESRLWWEVLCGREGRVWWDDVRRQGLEE